MTRFFLGGGSKFKKYFFRKHCHFSFGYFMAPMTLFRHMNGKRMPKSKTAHQITPGGTQTRKMTYDVIKGH